MRKPKQAAVKAAVELDYIHSDLRHLAVPLDSLNIDPENARIHGEQNLDSIRESLDDFGQRQPIVVQRNGMVVSVGNGRVTAARQLGWTHIAALIADDDDIRALAYAVADNRTSETATWDYEVLIRHMGSLQDSGIDVSRFGCDQEEIASLLQSSYQPPPVGPMPTTERMKTLQFRATDYQQMCKVWEAHRSSEEETLEAFILRQLGRLKV